MKRTAQAAAHSNAPKPVLAFDDLWDWAYCPLRLWWRKAAERGDRREEARVAEKLVRTTVQESIKAYYRFGPENGNAVTLAQVFGSIWRTRLAEWGATGGLIKDLLQYQQGRRELLMRFEKKGNIRRPDGSLYKRPTWTRAWRELAEKQGLKDLGQRIDRAGEEAGIPCLEQSEGGGFAPPMGLADAFAVSMDIVEGMTDMPDPERVIGVGVPLSIDLLSVTLTCEAPLVLDLGEKPARGRPPAGAEGPRMARRVEYEIHLYDEDLPTAASLVRDLRVLALSQAEPVGFERGADEARLERVTVRHMRTGRKQSIQPEAGTGADILDSLAKAVLAGVRGGAYVPRMVCGWNACGECEYRPLCFGDTGVMQSINPPMLAQIESNQRHQKELQEILAKSGGEKGSLPAVRELLGWMADSPSLTPEGVLWLLEGGEAEAAYSRSAHGEHMDSP